MNLKKQSNQMKATIKWWSEKSNSWKSKWSVVKHECKQLNKEVFLFVKFCIFISAKRFTYCDLK